MHTKTRSTLIVTFLATALMTGCVSKSKYVKEQQRADDLSQKLAQSEQEKQNLNQQLQASQQSAEELARQKKEQDALVDDLTRSIQSDQVKIQEIAGKVSINMVDKILFGSGSAKLKPEGMKILDKIGEALKKVSGKRIWVGGHTDNVAISSSLASTFASNWELSSARATAVVRYLEDKTALPGNRLLAVGLGEFQPVGDNTTAEGRAQNRRIEILLIPDQETLRSVGQGA